MNLLPKSLLNSLAFLPDSVAVGGLLRHAERHVILPGEFGNEVDLTEDGKSSCQLLAEKLSKQLISIQTSPVKRCLQTAQLLLKAAKVQHIQTSHLLGDPGIFIVDRHHAHVYCSHHEPLEMVQHLLSKQDNPAGFCNSTTETAYELIRYLLKTVTEPGLSLFITHDSILSVLLGVIFEELTLEYLWPTYLEGLFFWQQHNLVHMVYRHYYKKLLWIN